MAFEFTENMQTGNELIDSEHKKLIRAINALLTACSEGRGRQIIDKAVKFLVDYTKNHFEHEEKLQIEYNYPDYKSHKKFHDDYIKEIEQIESNLKLSGSTIALVSEVNIKASKLINHIKTMDVRLAEFIKSNK